MKIVAWTKAIYGDSQTILDDLKSAAGIPAGKRVVMGSDNEPHEIDVVAPNVDEDEFAKYNVCPVGTIASGEACLIDVEEKPLYDPPHPKDPHKWGSGCYGEGTLCPDGWIMGEKTEKIMIRGTPKAFKSAGIVAGPGDEGIDYFEDKHLEAGVKADVKTKNVCFKREQMPLEYKWIRLITDSIIGWGGYSEFPWWNLPWDAMIDVADDRYKNGAQLAEKKGFAVCKHDYNDFYCLAFEKEEDAKYAKEELDYFDFTKGDIFEDTKKYLKDEEGLKEKEITDEMVYDRINVEREFFWDDIEGRYPSYLGTMRKRWVYDNESLMVVEKREKDKYRKIVTIVKEL